MRVGGGDINTTDRACSDGSLGYSAVSSPSAILTMLGSVGRCCSGVLQAFKPGVNSLKTIAGKHAVVYSGKLIHFLNMGRLSELYVP